MRRLLVFLAGTSLLGVLAVSGGSVFADPPSHSNHGGSGGVGSSPGFSSNRGNSANSPGHGNVNSGPEDQGQQAAPCHGANNNACRQDPQPDRGRDCMNSDDHVCQGGTTSPPGGNNP